MKKIKSVDVVQNPGARYAASVKAVENLMVGERSLNVLCIETDECEAESIALARQTLIDICLQLCKEIYTTTHLAVWRRYLEGVWLHL